MAKPSRLCRLRVSLRGLLLLLTIFCIWASIHGQWIRDRREARLWIASHEIGSWSAADRQVWISAAKKELNTPWSLRVLGERPLYWIVLDKSKLTPRDAARIDGLQSLFPEAEGIHIEEPGWTTRWPPTDSSEFWSLPPPSERLQSLP